MTDILNDLFKFQDLKYKTFSLSLSPNLDIDNVIGVRMPTLRKYVRQIVSNNNDTFLNDLPHKYLEENELEALLINEMEDYNSVIVLLDKFLPYVNTWAITDIIKPKCFYSHKKELIGEIKRWLKSKQTYEIRYGIVCLMYYFLDADFKKCYLNLIVNVKSNEYYVNMARAWYLATALVNHYDDTIKIIEEHRLDKWTHNKTIQKAIESYRIDDDKKQYLKTLKIK